MGLRKSYDYGRRWDHTVLPAERPALQKQRCRVCDGDITVGELALYRSWGIEYAHARCGWCRPDELDPRKMSSATDSWWEWACPACSALVVDRLIPPRRTDGRYARCYCRACVERVKAGTLPGRKVER